MEKQGYRETIEFLTDLFPGKASLDAKEVAKVLNCDVKWVYGAFVVKKNPIPSIKVTERKILIPIPAFARWLCSYKN